MQARVTARFPQFLARTFKHRFVCRHFLHVLIANDQTSRWKPSKMHFAPCWFCCSFKLHFIITGSNTKILNFLFVILVCPKSQPSRPEGWNFGGVDEHLAKSVLFHLESAFLSSRVWTMRKTETGILWAWPRRCWHVQNPRARLIWAVSPQSCIESFATFRWSLSAP